MVSFEAAARLGAEYAELDVHMTRDGELVVSHDPSLSRACGQPGVIAEMNWADIAKGDAGYTFTPDEGRTFPFRDRGISIPRLADVLRAFSNLRFIVEIKQRAPSLVQRLIDAIDRATMRRRVMIACEHDAPIAAVREIAPEIPTNLTSTEVGEFLQAMASGRSAYRPRGDALQVPVEYEGWKFVTPETVAFAHEVGIEVHVWTVNNPTEIKDLLRMGVAGIITDFPARGIAAARNFQSSR